MARQQITVDTITPTSCSASSGPFYDVTYPLNGTQGWSQRGADIDGEAADDGGYSAFLKYSVSLSSNGSIMAIGAPFNDGADTNAGHVRIYEYSGSSWIQKGADIDGLADEYSGHSVSLSSDGLTVAIGATEAGLFDTSNGTGEPGHVRVYEWNSGTSAWDQKGADIDGEAGNDWSGYSVSLSSDGTIVAIGARYNDGAANGSGHVRVYEYSGSSWSQVGADIDGDPDSDLSGWSVSLSSDGTIVAIGAPYNDDAAENAGHVRVYEWNSGTSAWDQKGADIDGEASVSDYSGYSVSLSSDGSIVAIGAIYNDGGGTNSGHVRVYEWNSGTSAWDQKGSDIDGEADGDESGISVSLSSDGSIVAIGARDNDGAGNDAGHVRVYEWNSGTSSWDQNGGDIDGEAANDYSGWNVSLSSDGTIVAISAPFNDGTDTNAGHVRVYQEDAGAVVTTVDAQVGDWVYVNHEEAGNDGNVLSVYTYQVTAIVDADTLTLRWISATNGYVDDSPCDLCDGTGSSASCGGKAPHTLKRDLGSAYLMFVD